MWADPMSFEAPGRRLSPAVEDYVKAVFEIEEEDGAAATGAIADVLGVTGPSVSGMVRRLVREGLAAHERYRGVRLTPAGRRAALRLLRRHRILETYLSAKLGCDWDSVHEEADRLEHAVSDQVVERMALALGHPRFDPHGAPIPDGDGALERLTLVPLSEVPVGEMVELALVSDGDPGRLRFLASVGLRVGTSLEVVGRQPFRGPVTIRLTASPFREQVIGYELAASVGCRIRGSAVG
jgi:DtxR family Mn-dependent transcriptional regulator